MEDKRPADRDEHSWDDDDAEAAEPAPDVLPTRVPRGAQTILTPSQTGLTTPPISGWGETLDGEEISPREETTDPRAR